MTELERDESGRITRVITHRESEFSDNDREMLLGYRYRQSLKLPHGQPLDEVTDEHADPNYYGPGKYRYIVNHAVDYAQAAIEQEKANLRKQDSNIDLSTMVFWPERQDFE